MSSAKNLTLTALFAALSCLSGLLKIPAVPVPITLQLFFAMAEKRCAVINVEQQSASLEQVFLSLTDKTQGTPDKRTLRDKKRREKMLGNVKEAVPQNNDGGDEQ